MKNKSWLIFSCLLTVFLWGGNNTGVKYLVASWPPVFVGSTRFLCAGLILVLLLKLVFAGNGDKPLPKQAISAFWFRTGLSLALYIVVFNWAMKSAPASHVALYIGASPVWALIGERKHITGPKLQRFIAATITLSGVAVLFWPKLDAAETKWTGELLGLFAGMLWAYHGHQCSRMGTEFSGFEITAHTMWRAGVWLVPIALIEFIMQPIHLKTGLVLTQAYCILGGAVLAFVLWNNALKYWATSRVFLFINLIPLTTLLGAHLFLDEPVTKTFFPAMLLVATGISVANIDLKRYFTNRAPPLE
ncbi:MAG: DMT family transporter [Verrucomicrobia bacterium]|nr:DMT family transporter [Verrucomicrobiota bacterium]